MKFPKSLVGLVPAVVVGGVLFGPTVGCDVEEVPVEQRLCERFDACNYFAAGVSVEDCTDVVSSCTGELLSSAQRDWARETKRALENDNCTNFLDEYQEVNACTIHDDGSVDSPGPSPTPGDDDDDSGGGSPDEPGAPAASCGDDRFECDGDERIVACLDGEVIEADCEDVCASGDDPLDAVGCGYSEEKEHDVCFCDEPDVPEDPPPGPAPQPGE
ncbi:MAG: hypothetical protein ACRBN8_43450 [Nannocystales bacterium]